jgi:hypothetical protein
MAAEIGPGRLPSKAIPVHKDQSLILNQKAGPCTAVKCDSPLYLLQNSSRLKCIQEQRTTGFLDNFSSTLDLLRTRTAQDLIESCKEMGNISVFKHKLEYSLKLKFSKIPPESVL